MGADGAGARANPRIVVRGRRVVAATILAHARADGGGGHGTRDDAGAEDRVEVRREGRKGRDVIVSGGIVARVEEVLARPRREHWVVCRGRGCE